MSLKMNFRIVTKNYAVDSKIGSSQKIDLRADGTHESHPTAWELNNTDIIPPTPLICSWPKYSSPRIGKGVLPTTILSFLIGSWPKSPFFRSSQLLNLNEARDSLKNYMLLIISTLCLFWEEEDFGKINSLYFFSTLSRLLRLIFYYFWKIV